MALFCSDAELQIQACTILGTMLIAREVNNRFSALEVGTSTPLSLSLSLLTNPYISLSPPPPPPPPHGVVQSMTVMAQTEFSHDAVKKHQGAVLRALQTEQVSRFSTPMPLL
jgi:hypothetical protein